MSYGTNGVATNEDKQLADPGFYGRFCDLMNERKKHAVDSPEFHEVNRLIRALSDEEDAWEEANRPPEKKYEADQVPFFELKLRGMANEEWLFGIDPMADSLTYVMFPPNSDDGIDLKPDDLASVFNFKRSILKQGFMLQDDQINKLFGEYKDGEKRAGILPLLVSHAKRNYERYCEQHNRTPFSFAKPMTFITAAELIEMETKNVSAIDGILVKGQPCIIGGLQKTCKTTIALDAAISLASAKPFLNKFRVNEPGPVAFVSAESGSTTIRETGIRIAASKGLTLSSLPIFFYFQVIRLCSDSAIAELRAQIVTHKIQYLFLDPAYLLLFAGDDTGKQSSNIFDVGSVLWRLTEMGQETGCTIIMLHHFRKGAGKDEEPPTMADFSGAGFAEWARQVVLLSRREPYEPGSGYHQLLMDVGGSAGHSSRWSVNIEEGVVNDPSKQSRYYEVDVITNRQAITEREQRAEQRKKEKQDATHEAHDQQVLEALKDFPEGESQSILEDSVTLSRSNLKRALFRLVKAKKVTVTEGKKRGQKCNIYQLCEQGPTGPTGPTNKSDNRTVQGWSDNTPIGGVGPAPHDGNEQHLWSDEEKLSDFDDDRPRPVKRTQFPPEY